RVVFIDCADDVLIERFRETRRRHPLAADRPVGDGLKQERDFLDPLRQRADVVVDTSEMHARELKQMMQDRFRLDADPGPTLLLTSFGFKNGLPRDADLVFDVRFLRNPHYQRELRPQTGRDAAVAEYIEGDDGLEPFLANLLALLTPLIPRFAAEGKSYLTVAVGCTGGRHRSVYTIERLAAQLAAAGLKVQLRHRDLEIPEK
ncbi:MAG: RNase adapter RapZ, partial [Rhodospirillaceae bacterium]